MARLYPDPNEDPKVFLRRLREMKDAGKIRPNDDKVYSSGVVWAMAEIAKQESDPEPNPTTDQ